LGGGYSDIPSERGERGGKGKSGRLGIRVKRKYSSEMLFNGESWEKSLLKGSNLRVRVAVKK